MIETDIMLYCEDIGMLLPYEAKNYKELLSIMEQDLLTDPIVGHLARWLKYSLSSYRKVAEV